MLNTNTAGKSNPFNQSEMLQFYEEVFVPAFFGQWAELLVKQVSQYEPKSILDISTGPGTVIRPLLRRFPESVIKGVDPSEGFLKIAREKFPGIEFLQAGCEKLPVGSNSIDLITCQQGMQYFQDKIQSAREIYRVLKNEGQIAIAIWSDISLAPQFSLYKTAMKNAGASREALKMVELPFSWHDKKEITSVLEKAGFHIRAIETKKLSSRYSHFPAVISGAFGAPFGPYLKELPDLKKRIFEERLRQEAAAFEFQGEYIFPMSSHIIIGGKK